MLLVAGALAQNSDDPQTTCEKLPDFPVRRRGETGTFDIEFCGTQDLLDADDRYAGPDHCLVSYHFKCCGLNEQIKWPQVECVSAASQQACTDYNSNSTWCDITPDAGLSPGAIAGIAVGSVAFVAIAAAAVLLA
jgi:hypothetical protein